MCHLEARRLTIAYTGGATNGGSGTSASVTHGQAINSGDLVVVYLNYNNATGSITDDGGEFTEEVKEQPSTKTAQQAFYWKISDGTEPSAFTFTLGTSTNWRLITKVFTSATDAAVDTAANPSYYSGGDSFLRCDAIDGEVINDNTLSIICGGKDTRYGSGNFQAYDTADNSFLSTLGDTGEQAAAMAHRIYTTDGETFSGYVQLDVTDLNDNISSQTYSIHITFAESAAAAAGSTYPPSTRRFLHNLVR